VQLPPLSVLDLATVAEGSTPAQALAETTELARVVEGLGYRRIWVAEHHGMPAVASSAPAVLVAHLAAATSTIRVGSGGVMLPNHAPLVVAEQFGTLEALHPGRVDLGIGRAPGTDQVTARALRRTADVGAERFPDDLVELLGYFSGPLGHPQAVPGRGYRPEVWLLGSSVFSARLAGLLGLPFSFAHHFSPQYTEPALAEYRSSFRPSGVLRAPYAMVAVAVVCAPTADEAYWLAGPSALSVLHLRTNRLGPLPTPETAAAYRYTDAERELVASIMATHVVGEPQVVTASLAELAARTGADELMVTTRVHGQADRLRSFELVAGAWEGAAAA
jgi:luciferase family oxidoreductase group 1